MAKSTEDPQRSRQLRGVPCLINQCFEEVKALMRKTLPVARRPRRDVT